jgi:hypothetical protein
MHAARLAAAHDALLALLCEQQGDGAPSDGITVVLGRDDDGTSLDVTYTRGGMPVSGEGC